MEILVSLKILHIITICHIIDNHLIKWPATPVFNAYFQQIEIYFLYLAISIIKSEDSFAPPSLTRQSAFGLLRRILRACMPPSLHNFAYPYTQYTCIHSRTVMHCALARRLPAFNVYRYVNSLVAQLSGLGNLC